MALQPQEELEELHTTYEYTSVETSQFSQNSIPTPVSIVTFSPRINVVNDRSSTPSSSNNSVSSNIEDVNGIEKDLSTAYNVDGNLVGIINNDEFNFEDISCNVLDDWLTEESNRIDLETIDESIQDRTMSVETQPPTNIRRRYQSDGKRQIEKSRSKPMAIKLPNLNNCTLNSNQSFWIQLILITCNKNPANKVYIHVDKLEYHEDDLPECDHRYVRVPLTQTDIQKGIKQLARISIIKAKLDTYTFELIPFDPLSTNNPIEIYENKNAKSVVAKAKYFREVYNLKLSRIAGQLLIKQNETWFRTDIVCETNIMEEKETPNNSKKSNKRSASSAISDDDDDEYPIYRRSSAKKRKQSPSLMKGLPVTHIKKS